MDLWPDIKTANEVSARIREIVRYLRHSSKSPILVLIALLTSGIALLIQADQAKQFGGLIFKDDWQKISGYASLALLVLSGSDVAQHRSAAVLRPWQSRPDASHPKHPPARPPAFTA